MDNISTLEDLNTIGKASPGQDSMSGLKRSKLSPFTVASRKGAVHVM